MWHHLDQLHKNQAREKVNDSYRINDGRKKVVIRSRTGRINFLAGKYKKRSCFSQKEIFGQFEFRMDLEGFASFSRKPCDRKAFGWLRIKPSRMTTKRCFRKMPVSQMSLSQMPVGQISCQQNVCWLNVCQPNVCKQNVCRPNIYPQMSVGQMPVGQMFFDQKKLHQKKLESEMLLSHTSIQTRLINNHRHIII